MSTASFEELTNITIPVVPMFCPLMEQYSLVLPFLLYCCTDVLSTNGAVLTSITIPVVLISVQKEW
jgi:hypothetical protein